MGDEGLLMTTSPPVTLAESVALFERSAGYALEGMAVITHADLERPTTCPGWDLRELVLHLADAADALTGLITTGRLSLPTPLRRHDADPVAVAQDRTRCLLDTLRLAIDHDRPDATADRTVWATGAAHGGAIEFAAHGWDISTACGAVRDIEAGLASEVLELSRSLITDETRSPQFGPPVTVPATATPDDRLIAFLGRHPATRRENA